MTCNDKEEPFLVKNRPEVLARNIISVTPRRYSSKDSLDREGTGRGREAGPSKERARAEQGQLGGQVRIGELSEDSAISEDPQI